MTGKQYLPTSTIFLILVFLAVFGMASSANAQKIHALLVIMDDDLDLRQIVDVNRLRVKKMLQLLDVTPEIWQADDRQIQPHHISEWVLNRQVDTEDTILVYYSGHGHIDRKERHYLDLDMQDATSSLLRSDLVEELSGKRCRLKMLITDTCSNRVQTVPLIAQSAGVVVSRKRRYAQDLFLRHSGFLDITAASLGQYAWGNNKVGGYFTAALIESFTVKSDRDEDGFLSWKEVFSATRRETQRLFSETTFQTINQRKIDNIGQKTQTPKISSRPKLLKVTRVPVVPERSRGGGIIVFGHELSREEEVLVLIGIVLIVSIIFAFVLYKLISKTMKGKKAKEITKRSSTPDEAQLTKRKRELEHEEKNLRLRNQKKKLKHQEKNLNRKLSSGDLSQDQRRELKRQLKSNLGSQERVLKSFKQGNHIHRTEIRKLRRRIKNLR